MAAAVDTAERPVAMALMGQGDARWLVEDRPDGKNVNSWHWEEKNRLDWSKRRLAELLEGLAADIDASIGKARISQLKSVTGEALLTKRKGNKKFAVYDLSITCSWEGQWAVDDAENPTKVSGELSITEFASGGDHDDIHFSVTVTGSGEGQQQLKQAVEALRPQIFQRLDTYAAELLDSEQI